MRRGGGGAGARYFTKNPNMIFLGGGGERRGLGVGG